VSAEALDLADYAHHLRSVPRDAHGRSRCTTSALVRIRRAQPLPRLAARAAPARDKHLRGRPAVARLRAVDGRSHLRAHAWPPPFSLPPPRHTFDAHPYNHPPLRTHDYALDLPDADDERPARFAHHGRARDATVIDFC
jgi:hypothetical protein